MVKKIITMQLGKKGLTDEFLFDLRRNFEKYKDIRISILKSAREDKEQIDQMKQEILAFLGPRYKIRKIGFTFAIKRGRKTT